MFNFSLLFHNSPLIILGMIIRASLFSVLYRLTRKIVIAITHSIQFMFRQPRDLEMAEKTGDVLLGSLQKIANPVFFNFSIPNLKPTSFFDLEFPSPITFAAFKDHLPMLNQWMDLGVGGGIIKTVCLEPRPGNPRPRLQDLDDGLINALGLPGKGMEKTLDTLDGHRLFDRGRPVGISVGGHSLEDYEQGARLVSSRFSNDRKGPAFIELNISCPNTPDGQNMMTHLELIDSLLGKIRTFTDMIIGVKISPDQPDSDIQKIAEIAQAHSHIYINAGNTSYRRCEEVGLSSGAISIGGGGFSGSQLFPRTCEMIRLLKPFNIPIIATGGVGAYAQVKESLALGATLVGMATALVKDPYSIVKINHHLEK